MIQLLPKTEARLLEGSSQILKAGAFTADATQDAMIFTFRAMASTTVARRHIWLRAWQANVHSKHLVLVYPFQGEKLFGDRLEKILVEIKDKKKVMPRSLKTPERRGSTSYSCGNQQFSGTKQTRLSTLGLGIQPSSVQTPSFNPQGG